LSSRPYLEQNTELMITRGGVARKEAQDGDRGVRTIEIKKKNMVSDRRALIQTNQLHTTYISNHFDVSQIQLLWCET